MHAVSVKRPFQRTIRPRPCGRPKQGMVVVLNRDHPICGFWGNLGKGGGGPPSFFFFFFPPRAAAAGTGRARTAAGHCLFRDVVSSPWLRAARVAENGTPPSISPSSRS